MEVALVVSARRGRCWRGAHCNPTRSETNNGPHWAREQGGRIITRLRLPCASTLALEHQEGVDCTVEYSSKPRGAWFDARNPCSWHQLRAKCSFWRFHARSGAGMIGEWHCGEVIAVMLLFPSLGTGRRRVDLHQTNKCRCLALEA
jgi:hypothetical protein